MRGIDGHAHSCQLVTMNLVPSAFGQRFYQSNDVDPRLQGVVTGNQSYITAAHNEGSLRSLHQIPIDQRLESTCAINARQGIALEHQRLFPRPGGRQQNPGTNQHITIVLQHTNRAITKHSDGRTVRPHTNAFQFSDARRKSRTDVNATCSRVDGVDRAKEAMCLQHELAPQSVLVIDKKDINLRACQFESGRHAGRPAADDQNVHIDNFRLPHCRGLRVFGENRKLSYRFDDHVRGRRRHAGLHGRTLCDHHALGALTVGTEDALRRSVLGMPPEHANSSRKQSGGNGFLGKRFNPLPIERERKRLTIAGFQDWVFRNACHLWKILPAAGCQLLRGNLDEPLCDRHQHIGAFGIRCPIAMRLRCRHTITVSCRQFVLLVLHVEHERPAKDVAELLSLVRRTLLVAMGRKLSDQEFLDGRTGQLPRQIAIRDRGSSNLDMQLLISSRYSRGCLPDRAAAGKQRFNRNVECLTDRRQRYDGQCCQIAFYLGKKAGGQPTLGGQCFQGPALSLARGTESCSDVIHEVFSISKMSFEIQRLANCSAIS